MRSLFRWIRWKINGSKMIDYPGFNCGCCGKWVKEPFSIRSMDSAGQWMDTWGLCDDCGG